MPSVDITGAVRAEDVPPDARRRAQHGIWVDTAEQIMRDRKRGMVTVITIKAKSRDEIDQELYRMRNGLQLPMRKHGVRLEMAVAFDSDTSARCFMQTAEIAPSSSRRNGRK